MGLGLGVGVGLEARARDGDDHLEDGGGVGVRRLALGQLDRRDAEGPQVHLARGRGGVRFRVRGMGGVGVMPRDHRSTW